MSPPIENPRPRCPASRLCSAAGALAVTISLSSSLVLLIENRVLSGPGDQLTYYRQAAQLLPFTDHFYGPGYFVALRVVHDLTGLEWFAAGKLLSWISAWMVLLCTWLLARNLLGREPALLVVTLVALNPVFIDQSYSSLTAMFGAALALAAILATTLAASSCSPVWFLCGLVFGLAGLTRFQNNALLIGALTGTLILPAMRVPARLARAAWLAAGGVLPIVLWSALMHIIQGAPPENYNYVHMTIALGEFESFLDVPTLLRKYGNMWDVLTADRIAPVRIAAFAAKEAVKFPFGIGFHLVFLAAAWVVPGLVAVCLRRSHHGPWLGAFLCGLLLTGIGSRGWLHYYVLFLPFTAILVIVAIRAAEGLPFRGPWWPSALRWVSPSCAIVLVSTAAWSPFMVTASFQQNNWAELEPARRFLIENMGSDTVVCSTASSLVYGTSLRFIDQNAIIRPQETGHLVERLREHKVTHFVVTERHSLYEYPDLKPLLQDHVPSPLLGLRREFLVTAPMRLAIYRVLDP
jgi:hypothetical protein